MQAVAQANANIALVKYWGKRDPQENLPAMGSISLTLDGLSTRTQVKFEPYPGEDVLVLNGHIEAGPARARVSQFLDLVRVQAGIRGRAQVRSQNRVPTASGVASSASAFAALAAAACRAAGLAPTPTELSQLARRGSASAARSVHGGFVELKTCGSTTLLLAPEAWDVRMVVALCATGEKTISSRDGMMRTVETSPFYAAFVAEQEADLCAARRAIAMHDLATLGELGERSALKMHATALAARPPILYWNGVTVEVMAQVRRLRERGVPAYFTIDAGPHVKVLCHPSDADAIAAALTEVPGVIRTLTARPGDGAVVLACQESEAA
jgi:diphosphomevalonate decarboxylase